MLPPSLDRRSASNLAVSTAAAAPSPSSSRSSSRYPRPAPAATEQSATSFLHPEDAFYHYSSPPRLHGATRSSSALARSSSSGGGGGGGGTAGIGGTAAAAAATSSSRQRANRSRSRRRRNNNASTASLARGHGAWKKLLWVKQACPDNYTDEATFLDHLQFNPRLRPYEFWPLVADSTIIVQHLCSVVIFVCCFTAIFQERVSPQKVVGWATLCAAAAWVFRDYWQSREWAEQDVAASIKGGDEDVDGSLARSSGELSDISSSNINNSNTTATVVLPPPATPTAVSPAEPADDAEFGMPFREPSAVGFSVAASSRTAATAAAAPPHSRTASGSSTAPPSHPLSPRRSSPPSASGASAAPHTAVPAAAAPALPPYGRRPSALSPRMQERLATVKSAILIYCSLLGLSPILKSLTRSTSSDSIWALSSWLMGINVFTFDYGAGPEAKFPASLSTNAALMASTVLASRLDSTTHVFSLTLFSIEVFGLFPVFRRHLRHRSWRGHLCLTALLVVIAAGGLSMTISGGSWGWGIFGVVLGGILTLLMMGITSWWLIGLQRYKNEIHGPWDPARPVIRRHWD